MGVLRDHPNGFRQYSAKNTGIHAKNMKLLGPGDTTRCNFFEAADYKRDLEAWCSNCGEEARLVPAPWLLAAVEGQRSKVIVV
jgi:hypothetical protein